MAHGITTQDGSIYTGRSAWHGLGKTVPESDPIAQDVLACLERAGLARTVEACALLTADGTPSDYQLLRFADAPSVGICTVGPDTEIIQPADSARRAQALVDAGGTVSSVFSTRGQSRLHICVRMRPADPDAERVSADDTIERYALFTHSHDNSLGAMAMLSGVRAVCDNTVRLSISSARDAGNLLSFKKTSGVHDRLDLAPEVLLRAHAEADRAMDVFRSMRDIRVGKSAQVSAYLRAVFGRAEADRQDRAAKTGAVSDIQRTVETLMEHGAGADLPGVRGTAWGLYNATTEYLTHLAGRAGKTSKARREATERRFNNNLYGPGAKLLSRAASDDAMRAITEHAERSAMVTVPITIDDVFGPDAIGGAA